MIIEAVEQAAEKIVADAEDEARRYVSETKQRTDEDTAARAREVSALVETLDGCAVRLRDEMAGLSEVLGGIRARLAAVADSRASDSPPGGMLREVTSGFGQQGENFAPVPAEDRDLKLAGTTGLDAARLLATQMAMAGTAREKVRACLEQELPAGEVGPIIEAVFGSEA